MSVNIDVGAFPGQFSWRTAYWCGGIAALAYADNADLPRSLGTRYPFVSCSIVTPSDSLKNRILFFETDAYVYVGVEGTARMVQWLAYLHRMGLSYDVELGGLVPNFFYDCAQHVSIEVQAHTNDRKPLVLCGHSLGGATAMIAALLLRNLGWNVMSVWTYGAPMCLPAPAVWRYPITMFRMAGANDPVPETPVNLGVLPVANPWSINGWDNLHHPYAAIPLGDLDLSEVAGLELAHLQDLSFFNARGTLSAHLMGSYQEAIWLRLTEGERFTMSSMFDLLSTFGSQGTPNFALAVTEEAARPALAIEATESEAEAVAANIGPSGFLSVDLFTSPSPLPATGTPSTFIKPTFASYAPQRLPAGLPIHQNDDGYSSTAKTSLRWTLVGAFITSTEGEAGLHVAAVNLFREPTPLLNKGDFVELEVSLDAIRME